MSHHKFYMPPNSESRLAEMRQRMHRNNRGQEKDKLTPAEADDVIYRMRRSGKGTLHAYPCPECGWMHVGHPRARNERGRVDPLIQLESGDRVEACIRLENSGTQAERLRAIMQRLRAAEIRRLTRPSPPSPS